MNGSTEFRPLGALALALATALAAPGARAECLAADAAARAKVDALADEAATHLDNGRVAVATDLYRELEVMLRPAPECAAERATVLFYSAYGLERLCRVDEALQTYGEARALPLTRDLGVRMPGLLRPVCEGDCTHVEYPGVPPDSTACGRQRFAPPGMWAVTFVAADGRRRTVEVAARSGEVTVVAAPSYPTDAPSRALAWTLSGLTVALLGGATVAYVWTRGALDDGDAAHEEQVRFARAGDAAGASAASSRVDDARRDAESGRLWTYGLLGASALAAAGATWAWWPEGTHVVAGPGQVQAGLHLTW